MTCDAANVADKRAGVPASFWNERVESAAIVAAVAVVSAILFFVDPADSSVYPMCLFHSLTGLHCPGCGTLRALHQLLHMNLADAFRLNPLMALSMPFLAYAFLSRAMVGIRGKSLPRVFVPAGWIWALLVIIIAFWFFRNVPFYPFSLLAP